MKNKGFGLAIAFVLALCAMLLGTFFPIIGSSVFALILGIVLNELVDLPETSRPGLNWSGKKLLQYSIIFMGFSLPIATVASTGLSSFKISLPTITVAFLAAMIFGKVFHLKSHLRLEQLFVVDLLSQQQRRSLKLMKRKLPYLCQPSSSSTFWLSLSFQY